jgi:hypothetical protein
MIQGVRNRVPSIGFGLGVFSRTVATGTLVDIWLAQIYNPDEYDIDIAGADMVTPNHFQYEADDTGDFTFVAIVSNKDGSINKNSNTIRLQVV